MSVFKNSLASVLYRLVNMVFPLVTTVYVSHILLADGIGRVGFAQNIVQYFVLIAPLGIVNYGTREIAKVREEKHKSDVLFTELFILNLISTVICSAIYYWAILYTDWIGDKLLFSITGLQIVLNIANVEWYYQGQEKYVYIAARSIAVKCLSLIAMLLFVKSPDDYIIYALIYVLGIGGNHIFNIINLRNTGLKMSFSGLSIKTHLKPVFVLLASNLAIEVYVLLGTTLLGLWCSDQTVGYYTNATKLSKMVVGLIAAIGSVLLPRLSNQARHGELDACRKLVDNITMIMLFFAIPCGAAMLILAEELVVVLFGHSFVPAITTVRILSVLVYVLGFSNLYGTQVLLTFNQEKKLLICTLIGAISNFVFNIFLIPAYYHNGAAVATIISESLVTLCTFYFAKKHINISFDFIFLCKTALSTIIMLFVVWFVKSIVSNSIICLIVSFFAGIIVYLGVNLILKNPLVAWSKRFFVVKR